MATPSDVTVEYYLKNGQMGWALAAIIIGMPASWKALGFVGKFISKRFDNRDEMLDRLMKSHEQEIHVRMKEAEAAHEATQASRETAQAMREMAEAILELAHSTSRAH
jgi:HEPN domain-containing protein